MNLCEAETVAAPARPETVGSSLPAAIRKRVDRYEQFYRSNRPGDLLIVVRQNPYWVTKKNLFDYDFERGGHLAMAEDMARCAEGMLAQSEVAGDDLIPWMSPDFGIAIHHTYVIDMPVTFAEWTSWADHPLADEDGYTRLDEVAYNPDNRWVRLIREVIRYWKARAFQPYLVNGHHHFSPLDMANALRGNALFTDFYDVPEQVTELLRRCTDTIVAHELDLRREIGPQPGMPFWGALAPQDSLFLSEDAMDMIGPALSAQWGQPWSAKVRHAVGGLAVHHHMMGAAVQGVIGQTVRNSLIQISNDPNCPPAADKLLELYEASGGNALMFDCSLADLRRLKPVLPRLRAIAVVAVGDDAVAAREAVELIRSASNIAAS